MVLKILIYIAFIICITVAITPLILWKTDIRSIDTIIDGQPATVLVKWKRMRMIGNHIINIGGGHWKYTTRVTWTNGESLTFDTQTEPRTIWKSDNHYYVACSFIDWFIGRIEPDGTVRQVRRKDIAVQPTNWNLERPETQAEWQKQYETRAK